MNGLVNMTEGQQGVEKKKMVRYFSGHFLAIVGLMVSICVSGCSSSPAPDFERVKADLEKRLEAGRGDMNKGSADIYAIVSLAIVSQDVHDEKNMTVAFEGEVECLTGFYMAQDGKYSLSKPDWKAKRHVTRGSRFDFTGTAKYILDTGKWNLENLSTTMGKKYAPKF
jgi:hypothetical protein